MMISGSIQARSRKRIYKIAVNSHGTRYAESLIAARNRQRYRQTLDSASSCVLATIWRRRGVARYRQRHKSISLA